MSAATTIILPQNHLGQSGIDRHHQNRRIKDIRQKMPALKDPDKPNPGPRHKHGQKHRDTHAAWNDKSKGRHPEPQSSVPGDKGTIGSALVGYLER